MSERKLREKIVAVIEKWADKAVVTKIHGASVYDPYNAAELADALIGANIGDVTEWKHRAKVAERALSRLCDETMRDIRIIMYPNIGKQVRDKQELYDHCIEQAEREIKEEE